MLILCAEVFCLPCTPDMTVSVQGPAVDRDCCFQSSQRGLAKTLDFSDSPVPPVLHTPGVKQIPRLRDAVVLSEVGSRVCSVSLYSCLKEYLLWCFQGKPLTLNGRFAS